MNILCLDFGTKRIGMAWVDTEIGVVLPFGAIVNSSEEETLKELLDLIIQEHIEKVIVGLPIGLDGRENANTSRIQAFVAQLRLSKIPIEFYDERFSSQAGDKAGGTVSRDEKAAIIILEDYLAKNKL